MTNQQILLFARLVLAIKQLMLVFARMQTKQIVLGKPNEINHT